MCIDVFPILDWPQCTGELPVNDAANSAGSTGLTWEDSIEKQWWQEPEKRLYDVIVEMYLLPIISLGSEKAVGGGMYGSSSYPHMQST